MPITDTDDVDIDSVDADRAELQRIIDYKLHEVYQVMQFDNLLKTIQNCGIDKSFLYMYNRHGELANQTTVYLPSLEEFDDGYRLTKSETSMLINDLVKNAYLPGMEGNVVADYFRAWVDEILMPFRAGWRWFQSIHSKAGKLQRAIEVYIYALKEMQRKGKRPNYNTTDAAEYIQGETDSKTINICSLATLKKYMKDDRVSTIRKEANIIISQLNEGVYAYGSAVDSADRMRTLRDDTRELNREISAAVKDKNELKLASINIADAIKLGEAAIKHLEDIQKMDKTYNGFWYTGWSVGKLHTISSAILPPVAPVGASQVVVPMGLGIHAVSVFIHRGVISTASVGWQTLTLTVDAEIRVCKEIERLLARITRIIHIEISIP